MQVSTSQASLLRQPAAPHSPTGAAARSSDPQAASPSGGSFAPAAAVHVEVTRLEGERGGSLTRIEVDRLRRGMPLAGWEHDSVPEQVVRKRLAALDRMVEHRLEVFAERHAGLDAELGSDTSAIAQEFHASLKEAYDAFRESGDRKALWQAVRGAFSTARSSFRFVAASLQPGASGPRVIVDPGPSQAAGGAPVAGGEAAGGGSTTVAGGASGVTVDVTPLPPAEAAGSGGGEAGSLDELLAGLVQHFSELLSGLEDLIGQGLEDGPSFELAIDLHAELQVGGSSLGELLDALA